MNPGVIGAFIPIVMFISVFTFCHFRRWFGTRQKEREAFYKSETLGGSPSRRRGRQGGNRLAPGRGAPEAHQAREGVKIGGVVCVGAGVGLTALLLTLEGARPGSPYMVGLIPALVGVALLVYVYKLAARSSSSR